MTRWLTKRDLRALGRDCGLVLFCFGAIMPRIAAAQVDWQGASGGNWNTASNWVGGTVPGSLNEDVANTTANGILLNSGNYTINSFTSTNAAANFELFGGSLSAGTPGHAFNTTGALLLNGGSLSGFTVTAGGGVENQILGTSTLSNITFSAGTNFLGNYSSDTFLNGTITNNGSMTINGGAGNNSTLALASDTHLLGNTLTLNTGVTGGGNTFLQGTASTLTNDATIQGEAIVGQIGLNLINHADGTINANSTGGTNVTTLELVNMSGPLVNQGLMEASNVGVLQLTNLTVNNNGGNITANAGASVLINANTVIQGGTLSNNGGAFFGTGSGSAATLDGTTHGAITINGQYTSDFHTTTFLGGTVNNQGNILLNGGNGNNTTLIIVGATQLTGGGTLTLNTVTAGGGTAIVEQSAAGTTLENVNNLIHGNGTIGTNAIPLQNDTAGTVLADNGLLQINGGGIVTNNGTFQANAGSTLHVGNDAFTNFSGNTLTGGTYIANGTVSNAGTIQIDALGSTSGEIVTNAAKIILNGPTSNFVDAAGLDALNQLANNTATGALTVTGGRILNVSNTFTNSGTVTVGVGSSILLSTTNPTYTQIGGTTTVNGLLGNSDPLTFHLNAGTLAGTGTIDGNLIASAGMITPGLPGSTGTLTVNDNLTDSGSTLDIRIGGNGAGQYDVLDVLGMVELDPGSTLDVSLFNSFNPTDGETFTFLDFLSGGLTSQGLPDFFGTANGLTTAGGMFSISETSNDALTLTFNANQGPPPAPNGTPEPAPCVMLVSGIMAWMALRRRVKIGKQ